MMKTLVIGATGYVGSRIAQTFKTAGSETHGFSRSENNRAALTAAGLTPFDADLAQIGRSKDGLEQFDTVVLAGTLPYEDEQRIVSELLDAFSRPGKSLVFLSGSAVISTPARDGSWNEYTAAEDSPYPFEPMRSRRVRLATENMIRDAAGKGLRSFVIRPPLIYGHAGSIQVPQLFESARRTNAVCYLGKGLNVYSNVHVDDVARLAYLAYEKGAPGALYHAVAGEANFRTIAEAISVVTGYPTRSLSYEQAVDLWGAVWVDLGLAVNSRVRAPRAREELGWSPTHDDLIADIREGSYRQAYEDAKKAGNLPEYSWSAHG